MKIKLLLFIPILGGLMMTSCNNDEDTVAMPEATIMELGYNNSKVTFAGTELHIEAEILAEGKIDVVIVEIHPEGEHAGRISDEEEWEVSIQYTDFQGLRNSTFHKHIDVPASAGIGDYHLHFEVVDMLGQQTVIEDELAVQEPTDEVAPSMTISSAPALGTVFKNGETISISGTVSDDIALGGMYVGLVRVDQNLADSEVNAANTITVLHTHDFDSEDAHSFSPSIVVGAIMDNNITPKEITGDIAWQSAEYYLLVKCKDAFGGNWVFSAQYPIEIDLN
jgi:hypothetical protein